MMLNDWGCALIAFLWILDVALLVGAIVLFFQGLGILAGICALLFIVLTLCLTGGQIDLSDIFFFLD